MLLVCSAVCNTAVIARKEGFAFVFFVRMRDIHDTPILVLPVCFAKVWSNRIR